MHARVSILHADPSHLDTLRQTLLEGAVELQALPGFEDGLLLLDQQSGQGMSITIWSDEVAMRESADTAGRILGSARQYFSDDPERQTYEVQVNESSGTRRIARTSSGVMSDAARQQARAGTEGVSSVVQAASEQPGYAGFLLLVDPQSGRRMGISFWESREHEQASGSAYYQGEMDKIRQQWQDGQWTQAVYEVVAEI